MSYSCENYDTSNPTILTIEGVYKHGESQSLNVSQQVEFRDVVRDGSGAITSQEVIPLQRNHLYKVVLSPKYDLGGLVFDKISYSIQVIDWQSGETLKFAGDENLTKQSTPSFTVSGALSLSGTESDGKTNPTIIYTGIDEHSVYLTVTSQTTGTMLESTTFPSTQYGLVSSATTNDANGNLVETYKIDMDNNIAVATDYTFTLSNAINTSLARTFVLKKRPKLPIEYFAEGNVRAANNAGVWSFSMDPARTQAVSTASGTGGTNKNVTTFQWNSSDSGDNVMSEPANTLRNGITFTNVPGKVYRIPSTEEWGLAVPAVDNYLYNWGSTYATTGVDEVIPIAYPTSTLYTTKGYYNVVGTYSTWGVKAYAIRFENAETNNIYRCAYRYYYERIGSSIYGYQIIDVRYVGDDNSITLQYIQDNEATYWANPDATLVIPTIDEGHSHYLTATQYGATSQYTAVFDGTRWCNTGHHAQNKSQYYWCRLIEAY